MTAPPPNENKGKHILVVDDNATNRLVLNHKLSKMGFLVSCVVNGKKALEFVRQHKPDLVVMDLSMPVMDGMEATQRIRKIGSEISSVPIVGFSAHNYDEIRQKCLDVGMDDFLCKPVDDKKMLAKLNA
ncbi:MULTISPECIES: response regulator, partial [unclassified Roseibium]|uniref:response regulator n=1 Tax=unclassified Roseibium TaxID=2629323 RepID=UPI00273E9B61